MLAKLVPDLLTPCAPLGYVRAIRSGLETITGKTPPDGQVAVLTAQSALESGRWRSMHRFNPGNIKASADYGYLYCQYRCNEVIGGKTEWFDPPHPQTNFRAFMDLDTGVLDYLRFLSGRVRYASPWAAAVKGDPAAFVHALKISGYFTASEGPYLKGVVSLFNEYMRLLAEPDRDTGLPEGTIDHAAAVAVVAPDPDRLIHTEAVLAVTLSQQGVDDWIREERDAAMRESDTDPSELSPESERA
jgi:hypothetical protein